MKSAPGCFSFVGWNADDWINERTCTFNSREMRVDPSADPSPNERKATLTFIAEITRIRAFRVSPIRPKSRCGRTWVTYVAYLEEESAGRTRIS